MKDYLYSYATANFRKNLVDNNTGKDSPVSNENRRKGSSLAARQILQSLGEALPGFGDGQIPENFVENMSQGGFFRFGL